MIIITAWRIYMLARGPPLSLGPRRHNDRGSAKYPPIKPLHLSSSSFSKGKVSNFKVLLSAIIIIHHHWNCHHSHHYQCHRYLYRQQQQFPNSLLITWFSCVLPFIAMLQCLSFSFVSKNSHLRLCVSVMSCGMCCLTHPQLLTQPRRLS